MLFSNSFCAVSELNISFPVIACSANVPAVVPSVEPANDGIKGQVTAGAA